MATILDHLGNLRKTGFGIGFAAIMIQLKLMRMPDARVNVHFLPTRFAISTRMCG